MGFQDLPDEMVSSIMDFASPASLHALMQCDRRCRRLGAGSSVWRMWCDRLKLPQPRPNARLYKRSYDIFLKNSCKLCMERKAEALATCRRCLHRPSSKELRAKYDRWHSYKSLRASSLQDIDDARQRMYNEQTNLRVVLEMHRAHITSVKHAKRQYVQSLQTNVQAFRV